MSSHDADLSAALRSALDYISRHTKTPRDTYGKHARIMAIGQIHNSLAAYDTARKQVASGPHTAEPWVVGRKVGRLIYSDGIAGCAIAECDGSVDGMDRATELANARRIVACVNACTGTDTSKLESGDYGIMRTRWQTPAPKLSTSECAHTTNAASLDPPGYAARVAELESEGLTTSDAQSVADAECLKPIAA